MKYFDHLFTVEDIKGEYRDLAFKHHPDRGGNTATMQTINAQYHEALKRCNGQRTTRDNGSEHRYEYSADIEQAVIDKIAVLVGMNMVDVKVALIGTWLWVTGETRPYKDTLKQNGLKWHPTRGCWYFTTQKHYGRQSKYGLGHLAMRYGYKEFKDSKERIAH